ncbi:GDNF family receptor alpha-like [Thamnophis elegans]|uniref:GDNF family receptor alpha-like n=1 Tax=Thamnophis elegans TaxID=35005 RepID=UPI00137681FE|nr:GDNF family receptor alpha-like [Thamnophis elegans]
MFLYMLVKDVLVLYSLNACTYQAQTSKCQQLKERCVAAGNGCESVWNLLEEVCYISGNSCAVKDSTNCNKIIQFLVEQFPEFKDCFCIKDKLQHRNVVGEKCPSDKYHQFKTNEDKWLESQSRLNLKAIDVYNDMKAKSLWKLSALSNYEYKQPPSCFQANMECVNDEVCNKQLSSYLQACQRNGSSCDVNRCREALHAFYTDMPFQVAQMLTFCDCTKSDDNCHQARQFLHGHSCAIKMVPTPSCVHVMQACQENKLCWSKYEAFTSKCLKHISQDCLEENSCLKTWEATDPICSESVDCREAYVGLWGSVLRVKCTCEAASQAEQSVCQWFHRMLHGKVCLPRYQWRHDLYTSQIELPEKHVTGEQSLFYDDTIITILYVSCIILILGIILLALLKTRALFSALHMRTGVWRTDERTSSSDCQNPPLGSYTKFPYGRTYPTSNNQ